MFVDIFNGDADGIFALHQYRLAFPQPGTRLVTGVKRDIRLLSQVTGEDGCHLSVFDISLDANRQALEKILQKENEVIYFDHHFAGEIPQTGKLTATIVNSPEICTSLLVNQHIDGQFSSWAVCGAYGDNLHNQAQRLATSVGLKENQTEQLRELGELFNYNGYGESTEDLHFHPAELYKAVEEYQAPFDFIEHSSELQRLRDGYADDMDKARSLKPEDSSTKNRVYFLPNEAWARRVSGVFSNLKAREKEDAAHAIIGRNNDNSYRISVRAPLTNKQNADTLCRKFPTGGGRAAAAGINSLPEEMLAQFLKEYHLIYP